MTSTLLQTQLTTAPTSPTTTTSPEAMTWSNEKLSFSCIDNIGLKQLWKLIMLDSSTVNKSNQQHQTQHTMDNFKSQQRQTVKHDKCQRKLQQKQQFTKNKIFNTNNNSYENTNYKNKEYFDDYSINRDMLSPSRMSLLQFFAINALELSAPATPLLLQQNQTQQNNLREIRPPYGWMQLSGHPESIVPTQAGIVRKRISSINDSEVQSYMQIAQETETAQIVPHYYGTLQIENECFIELQDLLAGFNDPCVMDIKMGCRTFLESEVSNNILRADLYKKMIAVDPHAPTPEEHAAQAITKLRYMLFREAMSSSHTKGFRIEAIRLRGLPPVKDLKTVRTNDQIQQTIEQFLGARKTVQRELIKRLKYMRNVMEASTFFQNHEIVGSSIFIVYDDHKVGAWLIDFAKSRQLPADISVTHRANWVPGNREEGLLKGMDELIVAFDNAKQQKHTSGHKCLQI